MGEIKEINQVEAGKNKNLFRGRTLDGVWIEGYFFQSMGVENNVIHNFIMKNVTNIDVFDGKPFQASYIVDEKTVGQYTGLKDKNGKKIFEGDILTGSYNDRFVISYEKSSFVYREIGDTYWNVIDDHEYGVNINNYKIIGNIHDNPELLEVKNG